MENLKDQAASRGSAAPESASAELRTTITPAEMAEVLRRAGYRATVAEANGGAQVQSAVQGLGFFISFGNGQSGQSPQPAAQRQYLDFSFHCWLGLNGELPAQVIDSWNRAKRFARLFRQEQILVLTMDVLLAGGVGANHLQAQCEIWDHLIRDLMLHLRQSGQIPPAAAQNAAAA